MERHKCLNPLTDSLCHPASLLNMLETPSLLCNFHNPRSAVVHPNQNEFWIKYEARFSISNHHVIGFHIISSRIESECTDPFATMSIHRHFVRALSPFFRPLTGHPTLSGTSYVWHLLPINSLTPPSLPLTYFQSSHRRNFPVAFIFWPLRFSFKLWDIQSFPILLSTLLLMALPSSIPMPLSE